MMKKVLLSILLTFLPLLASAETVEIDGIWYNLVPKAQEAEVTNNPSGDKYSGDVDIPLSVTYNEVNYSVTSIGNQAFSECYNLTSIGIPNSIIKIEYRAFHNCRNLKSVTIPGCVSSIGQEAFMNSGLTSIEIPNSVTKISIMAFCNCYSLASIIIPNSLNKIDTSVFEGCTSLTSVSIPDGIIYITNKVFAGCTSLESVSIPQSVISIGKSAFEGCTSLNTLTLSNSGSIGDSAFKECSNLSSVIIPNGVTIIGSNAFFGCTGLKTITFSNNLSTINSYAFYGCNNLSSVVIPNSVNSIGSFAFYGCKNLISVTINSDIKNIGGYSFAYCDELTDVFCLANNLNEEGLYTDPLAFKDSYPQAMTLHVPATTIEAYRTTEPWSQFKTIVPLESGDIPEKIKKCATPEICYATGKVSLSCETEGVEFISEVAVADAKKYYDSEFTLSQAYKITVYATKAGYENSDVATREIVITGNGKAIIVGDVDGDGKVNVADHVKLSNIILNK